MFGKIQDPIQNENTPFYPRSPYGVSKLFGYWITKNYRESYGMYACTGILFNHESERRGSEFVTRKITLGLAKFLKTGEPIELGNLDAKRDWGHAQDYVEAMWLMLQQPEPEDFVIGTGQTHSIREFVLEACAVMTTGQIGVMFSWEGSGVDEKLVMIQGDQRRDVIRINPEFYRPAEVDVLIADASKADEKLGWKPKISFRDLVKRMMTNDING